MKTFIVILLSFCLISCSWFQPKFTSGVEGQAIPDFPLMLSDSVTEIHTATIPPGKPFILFLYQPYCPYCNSMTQEILSNISELNSVRLYMITSYTYNEMRQFSKRYQLDKYSNITQARDSIGQLFSYFNAPGVPYLAFYDAQKKLTKVIVGRNDFSTIKNNIPN